MAAEELREEAVALPVGEQGCGPVESHSTHGAVLGGVPMWVVVMRLRRMERRDAAARSALQAVTPSTVGLLPMSMSWRWSAAVRRA